MELRTRDDRRGREARSLGGGEIEMAKEKKEMYRRKNKREDATYKVARHIN